MLDEIMINRRPISCKIRACFSLESGVLEVGRIASSFQAQKFKFSKSCEFSDVGGASLEWQVSPSMKWA